MYRIISAESGATIGMTDKPRFIRKSAAGCYVTADETTAQGVAYQSEPYHLEGREGLEELETVRIIEHDAGETAVETAENTEHITETEDALCEQDAVVSARLDAIEDALCELDKNF